MKTEREDWTTPGRRSRWRSVWAVVAASVLAAGMLIVVNLAHASPAVDVPIGGTLAASSGCGGEAPSLQNGENKVDVGGTERSFMLRIPENYDPGHEYRLIFAFSWWGANATDVSEGEGLGAAWAYYGQQEKSENSAILVAPQALFGGDAKGWYNEGNGDLDFVDAMLDVIGGQLCVNPAQRFSVGFSFGGGMTYLLACDRPNVFRAVAIIGLPESPGKEVSGCNGGNSPVAYLQIQGGSDNYDNSMLLRDRFVRNNGCTAQDTPPLAVGSNAPHTSTTFSGCQAGYPVQWAAFDGGHNDAPVDGGGDDGSKTWVKQEIWDFLSQF